MATSAPRRLSRDDLVRMANGGAPWRFLPLGAQAIAQAPEDAPLRLLTAANFLRVGLRTPALELLDNLPPGAPAGDVDALRQAAAALPEDRVPFGHRHATLRANLDALRTRDVDLTGHVEAWRAMAEAIDVFRAQDGNLAAREAGSGHWLRLRDDQGAARGLELPHTPGAGSQDPRAPRPFILEGLDPPFMFKRLMAETSPAPDGYAPPVTLVQRDPLEFLHGLSFADLRAELGQARLTVQVGEEAGRRLAEDLAARIDFHIKSHCISLPTVVSRLEPSASAIVDDAMELQRKELERAERETESVYAPRDSVFWSARLGEAQDGAGPPLRILIPTSRYTTFVRHSAADLADAFERAGCRTRILIEPDDHTRLSTVAFRRAFEEFEPDLIVLINYTRGNLGGACPANVPFVCWAQDAMGHLFDESIGRTQGPLDFLIGNVNSALTDRFRFPKDRVLRMPVAASTRRFTPLERDAVDDRFRCDIAYVSHQSEPVDRLRDRLARQAAGAPAAQAAIKALLPEVKAFIAQCSAKAVAGEMERLVRSALRRSLGTEPDDRQVSLLLTQAGFPLADRVIRHEMIGWAAELAEEQGWTLKLFGRGWEAHPRFARHAAGEAAYGEELRQCYAGAVVHLHTSINALPHQRLIECAFSGGVPLVRLHGDEISTMYISALIAASERGPLLPSRIESGRPALGVVDHPELLRLSVFRQSLGLPVLHDVVHLPQQIEERPDEFCRVEDSALAMLVDPSETTFLSKETLREAVERFRASEARRRAVSAMIARHARETVTHDVLVRRMLEFVRSKLPAPIRASAEAVV